MKTMIATNEENPDETSLLNCVEGFNTVEHRGNRLFKSLP